MDDKKTEKLARLQQKVIAYIRGLKFQGASDWQTETALAISHQSASARRRELVLKGLVFDSGFTRMGGRGRPNTVWVAREYFRKKT